MQVLWRGMSAVREQVMLAVQLGNCQLLTSLSAPL